MRWNPYGLPMLCGDMPEFTPMQPKLKESNTIGGEFSLYLCRVRNPKPDSLEGKNNLTDFLLANRETSDLKQLRSNRNDCARRGTDETHVLVDAVEHFLKIMRVQAAVGGRGAMNVFVKNSDPWPHKTCHLVQIPLVHILRIGQQLLDMEMQFQVFCAELKSNLREPANPYHLRSQTKQHTKSKDERCCGIQRGSILGDEEIVHIQHQGECRMKTNRC